MNIVISFTDDTTGCIVITLHWK